MKRFLQVALGILSAIGGFVDIGDIVFNVAAGARFGYELIWVVALGVGGIIVYSEMCGRVAAVSGRPVFDLVRERLGFTAGVSTLLAATIVTAMTCAAEVGGLALVLELLSGWEYRALVLLGAVALVLAAWFLRFAWIERVFGYAGLCLLVFVVVAVDLGVDWGEAASGLIPNGGSDDHLVYAYFAIGLLGAAMTPYEVYFYSSGAVEDGWSPQDLGTNRLTAIVGYSLGGLLSVALMAVAAAAFMPRGIEPELLSTTALPAAESFGALGLLLALCGMLFAIGGAAIETSFSAAYNVAQCFGWEWGKGRRPNRAPRFALAWLAMFVVAALVVLTGIDPVLLTEYSVIFSVVALPLTYVPILLVANDAAYMGEYRNGRVANGLALLYLVVIMVVAIAAIPLMLLTNLGQG